MINYHKELVTLLMSDYKVRKNRFKKTMYKEVIGEIELALFTAALSECGGNQSKAARMLGMNRGTFRTKALNMDLI